MQEYNNTRENSGSNFLLLLLILALGVTGYFLWQEYNEPPVIVVNEEQEAIQTVRYTMRLIASNYQNQFISSNYTLKQLFILQQQGIIHKDTSELFTNATYNVSYDFFADSDEYYLSTTVCLFTVETNSKFEECKVYLDKTANVIFTGTKLDANNIQLILKIETGLVRKPLICVGYSPSVYNVQIEQFEKNTKPARLANTYDRCFTIGQDLAESSQYYNVHFNTTQRANFTFILVDQGYDQDFKPSYEFDNELPDQVIKITT